MLKGPYPWIVVPDAEDAVANVQVNMKTIIGNVRKGGLLVLRQCVWWHS